jgi:hypothetical protein
MIAQASKAVNWLPRSAFKIAIEPAQSASEEDWATGRPLDSPRPFDELTPPDPVRNLRVVGINHRAPPCCSAPAAAAGACKLQGASAALCAAGRKTSARPLRFAGFASRSEAIGSHGKSSGLGRRSRPHPDNTLGRHEAWCDRNADPYGRPSPTLSRRDAKERCRKSRRTISGSF